MSHGSVPIGTSEIRSQAQESGRYTPDPFPRERVGSGDETNVKGVSERSELTPCNNYYNIISS